MTTLVVIHAVAQVVVSIAFRIAVWYDERSHDLSHDLASRRWSPQNGRVDKVLEELEAHAVAVVRHETEAEKHREAIRELLPTARASGYGPARLERTIKSVYVRDTISRWTKSVAVPRGKHAIVKDA